VAEQGRATREAGGALTRARAELKLPQAQLEPPSSNRLAFWLGEGVLAAGGGGA
jgi:hypothetical protein